MIVLSYNVKCSYALDNAIDVKVEIQLVGFQNHLKLPVM